MEQTEAHSNNHPTDAPTSIEPADLRRRADALIELATQIEQSPVMRLPTTADDAGWHSPRGELCQVLLERNLHQLHVAADELRQTAFRLSGRADRLEEAVGSAA